MSTGISWPGTVARGFEPVREVFLDNFRKRGEIGAACSVYLRGEKVVDLWGGLRDHTTGAPWEEDTMVVVFSTTKGMSALALAVAHSRGLYDHDAPVARYWPEFAAQGKGAITVRQLLSHQAGLAAVDERFDAGILADLDRVAVGLAAQRPAWEPGRRHGYHGISLGWYEGELLRRVDPQKRSLGRFFADEIARPLGIDFHIGLPADVPSHRVARIKGFHPAEMLLHLHTMPVRFVASYLDPRSLTARAFNNPRFTRPEELDSAEYRAVEMPASNGIGTARGIARAYGVFAQGGAELGIGRDTMNGLTRPATPPADGARDLVMGVDMTYSLGFLKPGPLCRFGTSESAFGTPGAGGSFGFADPDLGLGFAYVMNRMGFHIADDPREKALRDAVYACCRRLSLAARTPSTRPSNVAPADVGARPRRRHPAPGTSPSCPRKARLSK
jgi:CubicO group peptidase (beta-lactamase class C family)